MTGTLGTAWVKRGVDRFPGAEAHVKFAGDFLRAFLLTLTAAGTFDKVYRAGFLADGDIKVADKTLYFFNLGIGEQRYLLVLG